MRNLLALSALTALSLAACSGHSKTEELSASDARDVLINRNWLDRMPETTKDRLHLYRFTPSMGGGVYQDRTLFKGSFELLLFKTEGDKITLMLPETHEKVVTTYKIERVTGPEPFDLKLTIKDDPRGPHEYYGIRNETDKDGHLLEEKLAAKRASVDL